MSEPPEPKLNSRERRKDKAEIQAETLGVVINWLRNQSHLDGEEDRDDRRVTGWAVDAQDRIACFVELEQEKLYAKSTSFQKWKGHL